MSDTTPRKTAESKLAPRKPKSAKTEPVRASRTYTVEGDVVRYTSKAGYELAIDLDFSPDLIKLAMGADDEDRDEDEQFEIMAQSVGENFAEAYGKMGVLERKRLQTAVFTEFTKAMGMTLGEASGSSAS